MKKINGLLCGVLLALLALMPVTAGAAGEAYTAYYDFDDYTEAIKGNQPVRPDRFIPGTSYGFPSSYFGSADCSDEGRGNVFAIPRGEATLLFDEKWMDGKIHISYEAKATAPELNMMTLFWNDAAGRGEIDLNNYSKTFFINGKERNTLSYYTSMTNWESKLFDADFASTAWHRFDIIATGITEAGSKVSTYVDGKLMHSGHTLVGSNGIFGLTFRVSYHTETAPSLDEMFLIDNLMVRRYYSDTALAAVSAGGDRISTKAAEIRVRLSERVDETYLTKEHIRVSGINSTPAYSVENVSDTGFDIVFAGEIPYDKYKVDLGSAIKGEITGTALAYPLEVKTEERWVDTKMEFAAYHFNSYTGGGRLPDGFVSSAGRENSHAVAVQNGSETDYALGFTGFEAGSRARTNMFIPFAAVSEPGKEYSVEFDVKAKGMRWYVYLAEEGDIAVYDTANAAVGADENGVLKYAKERSANVTEPIAPTDLTLTENEWHHIKLTVVPDADLQKTVYRLSLDDGTVYTAETERKLYKNGTEGIGFGYHERAAGAELYLDNISVSGETKVKYPEVEHITLYDANGNAVRIGQTVTTMIRRAEVKYNTYISDECYDYIGLYADSVRTDYRYEIVENEDKTNAVILSFDTMLEPLTEYRITAETGLASRFSDQAQTYVPETITFYTSTDAAYHINAPTYDADTKTATVSFVKNKNESGRYLFAVCAYQNTAVTADGETKAVKKLIGMNGMPIEIASDSLGVFTYTLHLECDVSEADEITPYLWEYPSLADVKTD